MPISSYESLWFLFIHIIFVIPRNAYNILWIPMNSYEDLFVLSSSHDFLCFLLSSYLFLLCLCSIMHSYACLWILMNSYEFLWVPMNVMNSDKFVWMLMNYYVLFMNSFECYLDPMNSYASFCHMFSLFALLGFIKFLSNPMKSTDFLWVPRNSLCINILIFIMSLCICVHMNSFDS